MTLVLRVRFLERNGIEVERQDPSAFDPGDIDQWQEFVASWIGYGWGGRTASVIEWGADASFVEEVLGLRPRLLAKRRNPIRSLWTQRDHWSPGRDYWVAEMLWLEGQAGEVAASEEFELTRLLLTALPASDEHRALRLVRAFEDASCEVPTTEEEVMICTGDGSFITWINPAVSRPKAFQELRAIATSHGLDIDATGVPDA